MFGRKKQASQEQGREGRQVIRSGDPVNPAFSYYTNRMPDLPGEERRTERQDRADRQEVAGKSRRFPRSWFTQLPFWILLAVFAVCVLKVLWLSANPKVVVVGKSTTSASYLQSSDVYAAAAHKILAGSITNYSKLTVNLDGTAKVLQQQFPELQNVSLGIPLVGSRPIVYVQVARPSLILQTNYGNYALNESGVVLARLQSVPEHVPTALDQSGTWPTPGKHFLPGSTVAFASNVAYQFATAHMDVNTFVLPAQAPYELDVRLTEQQYVIRMNLEEDARIQSGVAIATLQQLGSSPPPNEYLDVRTSDRVYFK
jgi:hypothetical protein